MGRVSRASLWVGAQLVVLAVASLPLWLTWSIPDDVRTLSTTTPSNDNSRATTLPDDWRVQNYAGDNAVYEFAFVLDQAPEEPWALLVPSVRMNIDVSVNGHSLVHDETDARLQGFAYVVSAAALRYADRRVCTRALTPYALSFSHLPAAATWLHLWSAGMFRLLR